MSRFEDMMNSVKLDELKSMIKVGEILNKKDEEDKK